MSTVGFALAQYAAASITMMLGNKLAVGAFPLPCTVVIVQAVTTVLLLQLPYCQKNMQPLSMTVLIKWIPVALLFTTMLYTSLESFARCGVATILIFRNVSTILTSVADYLTRGIKVAPRAVAAEVLIVVGAAVYGRGALDFTWSGLAWIMSNVAAQVTYFVFVKRLVDTDPQLKGLSKFTMSFYNNVLATIFVSLLWVARGEAYSIVPVVAKATPAGWASLALTCVFGFLISTSGFGLQALVSATTFAVVNNLTKFLNIFLGFTLLGERVDTTGAIGVTIALLAGGWYSFESTVAAAASKNK